MGDLTSDLPLGCLQGGVFRHDIHQTILVLSLRSREGRSALEATQGQMDGFLSQLPYKCHQNRVASVGDDLRSAPGLPPGWFVPPLGSRGVSENPLRCGVFHWIRPTLCKMCFDLKLSGNAVYQMISEYH